MSRHEVSDDVCDLSAISVRECFTPLCATGRCLVATPPQQVDAVVIVRPVWRRILLPEILLPEPSAQTFCANLLRRRIHGQKNSWAEEFGGRGIGPLTATHSPPTLLMHTQGQSVRSSLRRSHPACSKSPVSRRLFRQGDRLPSATCDAGKSPMRSCCLRAHPDRKSFTP